MGAGPPWRAGVCRTLRLLDHLGEAVWTEREMGVPQGEDQNLNDAGYDLNSEMVNLGWRSS